MATHILGLNGFGIGLSKLPAGKESIVGSGTDALQKMLERLASSWLSPKVSGRKGSWKRLHRPCFGLGGESEEP